MKRLSIAFATVLVAASAQAATWSYKLPIAPGKPAPRVEVMPLKYGKTWAYAFEQDDGPAATLTVSQPLLAKYHWNDAPPGIPGGVDHPFIGTAAVILGSLDAGNATVLTYQQIRLLQQNGWGIANHSYAHSGNSWDPTQALKPADFARELFWSQAVYAERIGGGRGAVHFVLPNGYVDYIPYLTTYGLRSSSRVGGSSPHNILNPKYNPLDLSRTYLDEGVWKQNSDSLQDFPKALLPGDYIIDFTHNIEGDPNSANYKRWSERLNYISKHWGAQGDNSMWVASTGDIVSYVFAARAAKVKVAAGRISLTLPDTVPGTALTLKITGLSPNTILPVPPGGVLYRNGTTAWLTTPVLGKPGVPLTMPRVHCIYTGELKDLTWKKPVRIAGVRIRQFGSGARDFRLRLDALTPEGKRVSLLPGGESQLHEVWGGWNLYPVVPDRPAVLTTGLHVTPGKDLNEMEIWAVSE